MAIVNYACNKYGMHYDPSKNLSNSSYDPPVIVDGLTEEAIIRHGCQTVDLSIQDMQKVNEWTDEETYENFSYCGCNVYLEFHPGIWCIGFLW